MMADLIALFSRKKWPIHEVRKDVSIDDFATLRFKRPDSCDEYVKDTSEEFIVDSDRCITSNSYKDEHLWGLDGNHGFVMSRGGDRK